MMLRSLAIPALILLYSPAVGEVRPANTLTPKEIADGWVLLFDGETDFGWIQPGEGGKWAVADGALVVSGGARSELVATTGFSDYEIRSEWSDSNGSNVRWKSGSIRCEGGRLSGNEAGKRLAEGLFPSAPGRFSLVYPGKGTIRFRNIKLRPLGLKSIFNGKDLSGWRVIPGHNSVFTVTSEGWLNVKNGNGEIQSEGSYGDFVLQMDIISNGDHLNGGIFFREEPGQFWIGYEAQIRNQWQGDDRTKPVDYGTGAIYNRQAARKVVSSDREWFNMTIMAHGNHLATWVNGYQVADFTDTRPANQSNARAGARTAPGVIGIQGHDPTTDLSFRSIRISELPPAGK